MYSCYELNNTNSIGYNSEAELGIQSAYEGLEWNVFLIMKLWMNDKVNIKN